MDATITANGVSVNPQERELLGKIGEQLRRCGMGLNDEMSEGFKASLAKEVGISAERLERELNTLRILGRKPAPAPAESGSPFGEDDPIPEFERSQPASSYGEPLISDPKGKSLEEMTAIYLKRWGVPLRPKVPTMIQDRLAQHLNATPRQIRRALETLRDNSRKPGEPKAWQAVIDALRAEGADPDAPLNDEVKARAAARAGVSIHTVQRHVGAYRKAKGEAGKGGRRPRAAKQQASPAVETPQARPVPAPRTEVLEGNAPALAPEKSALALAIAQGLFEASQARSTDERLTALMEAAALVKLAG